MRGSFVIVLRYLMLLIVLVSGGARVGGAQPSAPVPSQEQQQAAAKAAFQAALAAATHGPAIIALLDQGHLSIPAHTVWVPRAPANHLLEAWGNEADSETVGMVLGNAGDGIWTAIVSYKNAGFVKDDDAANLNAADILKNLREATENDNEARLARGFRALTITQWMQPPSYDAARKRLVWAFDLRPRDDFSRPGTVNYNTRALGRYGYFSLNLLSDPAHFAAEKPLADGLLEGLTYDPGKRYADFNAGTDHVAEYGLAALIGVVALKKLGLIAVAGAFILKFAKLGILAVVGLGASIRKYLRGRKKPESAT